MQIDRKPRELTSQEVSELYGLEDKDFNFDLMRDYFYISGNQTEPRFEPNDYFNMASGRLFNKTVLKTTIGKYIFNRFVFPTSFLRKHGYVNEPITKKNLAIQESKMAAMILNGELFYDEFVDKYINNGEWLGMGSSPFLLPSMNYEINNPIKEVIELRNELFEKYKKEIEDGDPNIANTIEKTLLDKAKKIIKESGNPSFLFFDSGGFSFDNNYKKTSIMGGAFIHPSTKKITISKSNYMDGLEAREYPEFSNLTVVGGYARGVNTQVGGYEMKKIGSAMQASSLDVEGSDCGTTLTNKITINGKPEFKTMFLNRYIVENGKLVLLTDYNYNSYVGKEVEMRSPMYCKSKEVCSKCAGELFYKLGIKNAGLVTSRFSGTLINLSMKKIHDSSIKFKKFDLENFIEEI